MVFGKEKVVAISASHDLKPKHCVFEKMECLVREMQKPRTGVHVRSYKTYWTLSPAVFTGTDLIQWLSHHLKVGDGEHGEAIRIAILLCHYGYIFPIVDWRNLTVKEDASLYRFQNPYYWPSQNPGPDNVCYAIHLMKRSMRNKQKHGLDDYEQTCLSKLRTMLCDKWDFIVSQAEDQVKLAKERKKSDKAISDSQERAFWRIYRPPPGCTITMEERPMRNFQPNLILARRKTNRDLLKKEIKYLKQTLSTCWTTPLKSTVSHSSYAELYHDFDPLLIAPLPSNPWISEDTSYFDMLDVNSEFLSEMTVRKWSISLQALLSDRRGRLEFEQFLMKEYSHENLSFWIACDELKFCPLSEVSMRIKNIKETFLTFGSPQEVNIDSKCNEEVKRNMKQHRISRFTFDVAQEQIFSLMKKDTYHRFLRSDRFRILLSNSSHSSGKKKFFSFGSRKKTLTPSPKPKRRGSTGTEPEIDSATVTYHSYSTGNLKELEDKALSEAFPNFQTRRSLRSPNESPSKGKQLEVPKYSSVYKKDFDKDDPNLTCLSINVSGKTNVVAPWEGFD